MRSPDSRGKVGVLLTSRRKDALSLFWSPCGRSSRSISSLKREHMHRYLSKHTSPVKFHVTMYYQLFQNRMEFNFGLNELACHLSWSSAAARWQNASISACWAPDRRCCRCFSPPLSSLNTQSNSQGLNMLENNATVIFFQHSMTKRVSPLDL
jgi:hypothetical protein